MQPRDINAAYFERSLNQGDFISFLDYSKDWDPTDQIMHKTLK